MQSSNDCKKCLKLSKNKECIAFKDRDYQLKRKGGCYGRVERPETMVRMCKEIIIYARDRGTFLNKEAKLYTYWKTKSKERLAN